ncbi:MAG: T9SS type A sorting domain-containing protein [Bacteroidales bacterium]|nr:T9SS type A sorting domain-containing protein [Bacteroidales bacterium]
MMFKKVLLLLLISCKVYGQINHHDKPAVPEDFKSHKQYKRAMDYTLNRDLAGLPNPDFARWKEWERLIQIDGSRDSLVNSWENFGPVKGSGRIISIAFHPTDSNTIYVGSAGGGLWKTINYGQTWVPLTDFLPSLAIGAIAINPKNPDKILIATGEGYSLLTEFSSGVGILVSEDAGQTFSLTSFTAPLSQNFSGMDIIWNTNDTNKVCVATSFGVYFSNDGGYSYTGTLARLPSRMLADPLHPDTLYLTARYYSPAYPGGFFRSYDMGQNWTQIETGLPNGQDFGYASIAVHPMYPNKIILNISESTLNGVGPMHGLYKSDNWGLNWTNINTNVDLHCYPPPYNSVCQGWFANTICFSESDSNTVFAGGCRLWKSNDGGNQWINCDTTINNTYALHVDHHQTLYHPITGHLFDVNDGGVNYSPDEGNSWISLSDGLITHQFYTLVSAQTDPEIVVGGAQDVGFFSNLQAHSSAPWANPFNGDAFGSAIDYTNKNIWYTSLFSQYKRVKTFNSGGNWQLLNNGTTSDDQWRMPLVMSPINPLLLLSSNNFYMYKTTDGGSNWQTTANTGLISCFEFDKLNPNLVYAAKLYAENIYRSLDAGSSWTQLNASPGSPVTDLAADPNHQYVLYATVGSFASQNQVFKSTDAGNTWNNISNNFPHIPATTIVVDPFNSNCLYVGADLGVWKSMDGGANWALFNNNSLPYVAIGDMHYYKPDSTLRVGTYGRGYWRIKTSPEMSSVEESDNLMLNVSVYPNPCSDFFQINCNYNHLEINDLRGQKIYESFESKPLINIENIPNGLYLIKITSKNNQMFYQKICVLR